MSHEKLKITLMPVFTLDDLLQLFVTPWTVAFQAPLSVGLFRQEYWSGLPCPPPDGSPTLVRGHIESQH